MTIATWKAIKPQKLKQDKLRLELLNAMRKTAREIVNDYKETTRTWEGDTPEFDFTISLSHPGPTIVVGPTGSDEGAQKWVWLDEGTPPHQIRPKRAKALRFPGTFRAKTTPGVLASGAGGSSGEDVFAKGVMHPGTRPRMWSQLLAKKWASQFKRDMEAAMRKAAAASGHGI